MKRLDVAFLWHMHQPLYKDPMTGKYHLPWVRLHSTYSYLDMISILDSFPDIRCTFNFTASLLVQLKELSEDKDVDDAYLNLSRKDPSGLLEEEKIFILKNFFSCNPETAIYPLDGYKRLFLRRGEDFSEEVLRRKLNDFSDQDILDLQVYFNLAWCGFTLKCEDALIKGLIRKGKRFSVGDKNDLLEKQKKVVSSIIPLYKKAQDEGRIEISTTPFHHPILPLLLEMKSDKSPPTTKDALWHIKKSVQLYRDIFKRKPVGMWPAEGSVSEEAAALLSSCGIKWIATDEAVLAKSFHGKRFNRDEMVFCPFITGKKFRKIGIIFRDLCMSNDISFRYAGMKGKEAAKNLFDNILGIRNAVENKKGDHIVSIILDGENPWPHYPDGGENFLTELYRYMEHNTYAKTVTVGSYMKRSFKKKNIPSLARGSWINADFRKWAGSPQKDKAWELLRAVREDMYSGSTPPPEKALEELYIAESSDWFWWYDEFGSSLNFVFDKLFRMHLMNIYRIMKKPVPRYLERPICGEEGKTKSSVTDLMVPPVIDGKLTHSFEWETSRQVSTRSLSMSMVKTDSAIQEIAYGMDEENLFFMARLNENILSNKREGCEVEISIGSPLRTSVKMPVDGTPKGSISINDINGKDVKQVYFITFCYRDILEAKIPFSEIGAMSGDEVNFKVNMREKENVIEIWPQDKFFKVMVP